MWNDRPVDDYDKPRVTEWDTLEEAREAANASPGLRNGSVLFRWVRELPDGMQRVRYSWRDTDLGIDRPRDAEVLEKFKRGSWVPVAGSS